MIQDETFLISPALTAAANGRTDVLQEFLRVGYDMTIPNRFGLDCEMLAWKHGHKELANLLKGRKGTYSTLTPWIRMSVK